jgi:large subunit ribosomal protein L24e
MPKCTFCGRSLLEGTGKMFVFVSGKINYYCSNKCEKNLMKLNRKPLQTKWTNAYRREHKKSVAVEAAERETASKEKKKSKK